ncbi:hypothetical protein BU17DRAFT_55166, partial [Hysterangium stoloniferum]
SASAFGQPSQPTSTFGQTSQPTSVFAAPAQPTSSFSSVTKPVSAFGQSAFDHASFSFENSKDLCTMLLPPNYLDIIPKAAKDAFASQEFQWGHVPEWAPPMEMR